ncbi:MAG: TSUP family transporter [Cyanobacteria bacterium P01_D01_bin.105]
MISLLIFGIGLVAGFVDAIAGGGGLIMLPGLLFAGLPVSSAIATNKLCGTFGAFTSTLKFAHGKQVNWLVSAWMALPVVAGAAIGSQSIDRLPAAWAEPLVILLIVIITAFVVLNPAFGVKKTDRSELTKAKISDEKLSDEKRSDEKNRYEKNRDSKPPLTQIALSIVAGTAIGFHDGFFGPGTGIFLVFSLLSIWPMDFLLATGTTKLLNFLTNVTALITFAISGTIVYSLGFYGAVGVATGSYLGASFATKKGAAFIRPIFVIVTTALVLKLAAEYVSSL